MTKSRFVLVLCVAVLAAVSVGTVHAKAKNVILMITDGRSYAAVEAAKYWRGSPPVYEGKGWTRYSMSTFSADNDAKTNPLGYDPTRAWENNPSGGLRPNMVYLKTNATDSASGITAMVTGHKNHDGSINWSVDGKPLTNIAQIFKANGRAAGTLSTVNWTHATPAGIGAHNSSRNKYIEIATEMLNESNLDVIVGAGNPWYDDNGKRLDKPNWKHIGEENWKKLENGSSGYTLIQSRDDFIAMGKASDTPKKLCGTFQAISTAQQGRSGYSSTDVPGRVPRNENIPTMSEMALTALNVLKNNDKGFFIMMEGGAIDWAAHANQTARLIEEQMEFDEAVGAVSQWVEANGGWKDNLLIITSDHGNGMITGPYAETHVVDNGKGVLPGMRWNHTSHTNEIVPLYARGAGAGLFRKYASKTDPVRGKYCDNTDIIKVMLRATGLKGTMTK